MYKVIHLTTATYVTDLSTGEDISYFSGAELQSQVFDNRYAVFCKDPLAEDDRYFVEIRTNLSEEGYGINKTVPKWQFDMVEEPGCWNV
jgi:hypothetical protein